MSAPKPSITDSRSYGRALERELVIGGLLIGLVVGVGSIYLMWGASAAFTSLLCFGLFLLVIGLVWGFLSLTGWMAEREW